MIKRTALRVRQSPIVTEAAKTGAGLTKYAKCAFALGVSEGEAIRVAESFCISPELLPITHYLERKISEFLQLIGRFPILV